MDNDNFIHPDHPDNPLIKVQTMNWNKERLTQLKNLFPDLFTNEGKLNIEELKKVIDPASVTETERFEFRWFGKSEAKRNAFTPSNATLIFDEQRSVNPTESKNIIIEGENFETLKLLSNSYREQVKCIYIDPPYNTGKDFVYSDNFTEDKKAYWENNEITENGLRIDTNVDTDGRFHSNWLNMMYSRLLISRQLLKEDGVIFISIDDNEVHHLRKLCDEVFGEENFIATFIWNKKNVVQNDAKFISVNHEYIICYGKSIEDVNFYLLARSEEQLERYSNPDNDERGAWTSVALQAKSGSSTYEITFPNGVSWKPVSGTYPRLSKDTLIKAYDENRLWFGKEGNNVPRLKKYLTEVKDGVTTNSILLPDDVGSTQLAKEVLKRLIEENVFDTPKPINLIKRFLQLTTNGDNAIVLDFFAGSGATGQAVIEQNIEDGGNRKFILVQIPEATDESNEAFKAGYKKISDITIERNKRVVEKLIEEKKKEQPTLFTNGHEVDVIKGLGFKVFKLVKSNFPRVEWAPDVDKTDEENIASLKKYIADKEAQLVTAFNRNELLTEILLKNGFQLNYKADKQEQFKKNEILLATDGIKETLICLDVVIDAATVEHFKKHTNKKFICLERALDTTKKYNLKHYLGDLFHAF
jgi:adenine-specific DNA-methyltransferase